MSQPGDATTGQTVPAKANCVVIGAGIVGNCLVAHLSRLGWTDIVQIDKGPLPNPGGSTGHASNFIFRTTTRRWPSSRWRASASTSSMG
jgi:glycine/D-amino acid oxidase-like deaminating enzyme